MKFSEIKDWEIFTIGNSPTYPKYKITWWYIDIRDKIKKMWDITWEVRLMTKKEIWIAFYWKSILEAKKIAKEELKYLIN